MATEKLFKVVGISTLNNEYKVRFANDIMRIKVLAKNGHEDIRMAELEEPLNKYDAVMAIKDLDAYQDAFAKACIDEWLDANRPKTVKIKEPVAVAEEQSVEVRETEDDDVPF